MKEILEHISKIDAIAYQNEKKIQTILVKERRRLENEMKQYHDQVLSDAREKADLKYNELVNITNSECHQNEELIKKFTNKLKNKYQAVENDIVREVIARIIERA